MKGHLLVPPARLVLALGALAGTLAGVGAVAIAAPDASQQVADAGRATIEASHVPPLLTVPGEPVELVYDAFCIPPSLSTDTEQCDVTGSVLVRAGASGSFERIGLEARSGGSRLAAQVPNAIAAAREGFTYFAELVAPSGETLTVPAGGAAAPHQSRPLEGAVDVDLGRHVFDATRRADERVAAAAWGSGSSEVGLEGGRNLAPTGASAFDVGHDGVVSVLDEAHLRVLRWKKGASRPERIPVSVTGTLADMTVAPDGTLYVLETVARAGRTPLVRRFDADGRELDAVETADRTPSRIAIGPDGPMALQQPSEQWMPVAAAGWPVSPADQRRQAVSGRPLRGGGEIVVLRHRQEIRLAHIGATGAQRSWRITSATPLAEVQLAEPLGRSLVVVVRAYTDERSEFVVLVLDRNGIRSQFSLLSADWAEAAPLGRFRLVGSSLYRLGSTPAGAFVDRFDLEVRR